MGRLLTKRRAGMIEITEDTTQPDLVRRAGSIELSAIELILGKLCLRDPRRPTISSRRSDITSNWRKLRPGRLSVVVLTRAFADPFDTLRLTLSGLARRLVKKLQFSGVRVNGEGGRPMVAMVPGHCISSWGGVAFGGRGSSAAGHGGILGTILNSALTKHAHREWERRPIADNSCLEERSLSADRLAAEGIGPNDPGIQKVFRMRARCRKHGQGRAYARRGHIQRVRQPRFRRRRSRGGRCGLSPQRCLQDIQVYTQRSVPWLHVVRD